MLLPQFGGKPRCSTVYIGNENTYTPEKYQHALAKAVELRQAAEAAYERATTLARRRDGKAIKQGTLEHKAPKAAKPTKRKRRAPAL